MAIIVISVTESSEQIVSGIPKTVSITTNIPSSIFYTLDGSIPTVYSNIFISPIFLPVDKLSVVLSILATNGIDYSPVITETYSTNILNNTRLAHSATTAQSSTNTQSYFPFGSNSPKPNSLYLSPGDSGVTVNIPETSSYPSGYNESGNPDGYTTYQYNIENYEILYSQTNAEGKSGRGIGNLPAQVTIKIDPQIPEISNQFSNLFDPRALVIYQDVSKEDPNDPPSINRQSFSFENAGARDGTLLFSTGLESATLSANLVKSFYNSRENTITSYYYDSWANRWLIAKSPYTPSNTAPTNLAQIKHGRDLGSRYVYASNQFQRRVLF